MSDLMLRDDPEFSEFMALFKQANKKRPNTLHLQELKTFLETHPDMLHDNLSIANMVLNDFIDSFFEKQAEKELMRTEVNRMKNEFSYQKASIIEKMLFDTVLVSWVRLQYLEGSINQIFKDVIGEKEVRIYNKLLDGANRRFIRAVDSLGRIKKYNINFQVNIAMDGGQQANIQDNK